jgi:hypothetical protein
MKRNYTCRTTPSQILPENSPLLSLNYDQPTDMRKLDFLTHLQGRVDAFQSCFEAFLGFVAGQSSALLDLGYYGRFG